MSETNLKNAVLDFLKYRGFYCWLTNTMGNYNKLSLAKNYDNTINPQ